MTAADRVAMPQTQAEALRLHQRWADEVQVLRDRTLVLAGTCSSLEQRVSGLEHEARLRQDPTMSSRTVSEPLPESGVSSTIPGDLPELLRELRAVRRTAGWQRMLSGGKFEEELQSPTESRT